MRLIMCDNKNNREHGGIKSNLLGGVLVLAGLVVIAMLALPKSFSRDRLILLGKRRKNECLTWAAR